VKSFLPSWKRYCVFLRIEIEDKLTNHLSLIMLKEEQECYLKKKLILITKWYPKEELLLGTFIRWKKTKDYHMQV